MRRQLLLRDVETIAHDARLRFIRHEIEKGLALVRFAREERFGNRTAFEIAKTRAAKTYYDFRRYLDGLGGRLTAVEEEQLQANLESLGDAIHSLD
jgi:hypothetical protein